MVLALGSYNLIQSMETNILQTKIESFFSKEELCLIEGIFREKEVLISLDEDELLNAATRNGLSSLLHESSLFSGISVETKTQLKQQYVFYLGRNTAFQLIAKEIIEKFNENNIPAILLKGIFLSTNIYKSVALRPMSDIDILIPHNKVYEAWKLLNPQSEIMPDDETGHHFPGFNYHGINIELHRALFPSNVKYRIPVDIIWQNTEPIENIKAFTLNPVHLVIYQLLHIYYTYRRGGLRLGWFYDIKTVIDYYGEKINFDEVKKISNDWNIYKPIELMLLFYTVLIPENKLAVHIEKKDARTIKQMIDLLHISDKQKLEYSYGVAFERLLQTKGFMNKCRFVYNAMMTDNNNKRRFSFKRAGHILSNTFKLVFRKISGR